MLYELKDIKRVFKGRTILDLPDLEIAPSRIYSLIGPNGAGKTTLLQLLAFLDRQTEGVLRFTGEEVTTSAAQLVALRRRVVLLDQYPILFTGAVWKNVEYGLRIRKVPAAERKRKVDEVLDLVGMQSFYRADAHKLSGGETKRVALARALAVSPEVLLCDEPGANVDRENQEIILSILDHINRKNRTSVIFSTHYLVQGRSLAHETLVLERGRLADMVNENIYRAELAGRENGCCLCTLREGVILRVPEALIPGGAESFKLHIDPEGVAKTEKGLEPEKNVFSGHVIQVNQDRGRVRIGLDIGVKIFYFEKMADYLKNPPHIGGKVTIAVPADAIRYSSL